MNTLQKDGRTLAKEDIYLDLSKLGREEIKNIPKILKESGESISFYVDERLASNNLLSVYFDKDFGLWTVAHKSSLADLTEISYPDFVKLFQKEITELPEKWFICGGEELADYFKKIGIDMSGTAKYSGYFLKNGKWGIEYTEFLEGYTEITVADYKRLTENKKQKAFTLMKIDKKGKRTYVYQPSDKVNTLLLQGWKVADEQELFPELTDEYLKDALEKRDYFVFPKAPEGDFPDLTGFEGEEMYCGSDVQKFNVICKRRKDEFITDYTGFWGEVRPIQKHTPTVQELWDIAEKAGADLSKFEKPKTM